MYIPRHFAEPDTARLHALMRRHDFALLVAAGDGAPEAVHLPFLLDADRGPLGTLVAHMARANPLWRRFGGGREVLVVFQGPHAYVSPAWYAAPGSVPTWNYTAVHAYGVPAVVSGADAVRAMLDRLVATHEDGLPAPWCLADAPPGLYERMVPGIVAFEIPLARLEGKSKLSQNKTAADRAAAAAALRARPDAMAHEVAALMAAAD